MLRSLRPHGPGPHGDTTQPQLRRVRGSPGLIRAARVGRRTDERTLDGSPQSIPASWPNSNQIKIAPRARLYCWQPVPWLRPRLNDRLLYRSCQYRGAPILSITCPGNRASRSHEPPERFSPCAGCRCGLVVVVALAALAADWRDVERLSGMRWAAVERRAISRVRQYRESGIHLSL